MVPSVSAASSPPRVARGAEWGPYQSPLPGTTKQFWVAPPSITGTLMFASEKIGSFGLRPVQLGSFAHFKPPSEASLLPPRR